MPATKAIAPNKPNAAMLSAGNYAVAHLDFLTNRCVNMSKNTSGRTNGHRSRWQVGSGRWRKLKGIARVRLAGGQVRRAEVHWYEAHGIGRKKMKIKRFLS